MSRSLLAVALLAAAPISRLNGQMVVVRPQELDSARAEVLATFKEIRDTVRTVEAAVAQLERGFAAASNQLLSSRSRRLAAACESSLRNMPRARAVAAGHSWSEDLATRWQQDLVADIDHLSGVLQECSERWRSYSEGGEMTALRQNGLSQARSVGHEVLEFHGMIESYYKVLGIRSRQIN